MKNIFIDLFSAVTTAVSEGGVTDALASGGKTIAVQVKGYILKQIR